MTPQRECPHTYAQRRANETGRAYVVSSMGHAMAATPDNVRLMERELDGVLATYRPKRGA